MKNKGYLFGLFSLFLFLIVPFAVKAGSGSLSISGNGTLLPYKSFTLDVVGNASDVNIMGAQGVVASSNPSCVTIENISTVLSGAGANGSKFTYLDMTGKGFSGSSSIVRLSIKTVGESCSATISVTQGKLTFTDSTNQAVGTSKSITVTAPPSTNNNLSSLTVSAGSLSPSFNSNTTSYTVNVDQNSSSISIGATVADNTASVSGLGNKNLNYGNNSFNIVVKAQSGDTKTYTVNVVRKDERSSDNSLKSLNISNGSLSPGFSSGTTSYNMSVPFEVSKLNISAQANDSKATVSINNPELVAEKTSQVTIVVKAENGSTKTYTINVSRGKDPNKVLSTDNKLLSLVPSVGILSPVFDSNKNNYYVYLPYEVDKISFDYEVSDKVYATVVKDGNDELEPDNDNFFSFTVTAEDGSKNIYTVTVNRARNHDGEDNSEVIKKIEANKENVNLKCDTSNKSNKTLLIALIIIIIAFGLLSTYLFIQNNRMNEKVKNEINSSKKSKKTN